MNTPPRPSEVIPEKSDLKMKYQGMTELPAEDYQRLAEDIRERGVLQPVIVDRENRIIDGHHREALAQHFELEGGRAPAYITLADLDDDGEKLARGIKQNLIGRDTTDAVKSHAVEQYIQTAWDQTDDGALIRPETDTEVAEKLGVSQELVTTVVNRSNDTIIYHDRVKAREYYEENPDASYRDVARQVEASRPTVTEWLKEDFDEGDDKTDGVETEPANLLAATEQDREKNNEIAQAAIGDGGSSVADPVQETAEKQIKRVRDRQESAAEAYDEVETAAKAHTEQLERKQRRQSQQQQYENSDETARVIHGDATEVVRDELAAESVDHIITDPPYTADAVEDGVWSDLSALADYVLKPGGFVVSYGSKVHIEEMLAGLSADLDYYWQLILNHNGPGAKIWSRDIRTGYKPVVVYQKPTDDGTTEPQSGFISDVIEGTGREKDDHEWQQAEGEAAALLERFTEVNDRILDPFAGSGTVGLAASRLQRQCVLIDRDRDAVETVRERVIE